MKRALVALITGTVLCGLAAAYASAVESRPAPAAAQAPAI